MMQHLYNTRNPHQAENLESGLFVLLPSACPQDWTHQCTSVRPQVSSSSWESWAILPLVISEVGFQFPVSGFVAMCDGERTGFPSTPQSTSVSPTEIPLLQWGEGAQRWRRVSLLSWAAKLRIIIPTRDVRSGVQTKSPAQLPVSVLSYFPWKTSWDEGSMLLLGLFALFSLARLDVYIHLV